jgi:hypothetical protein
MEQNSRLGMKIMGAVIMLFSVLYGMPVPASQAALQDGVFETTLPNRLKVMMREHGS